MTTSANSSFTTGAPTLKSSTHAPNVTSIFVTVTIITSATSTFIQACSNWRLKTIIFVINQQICQKMQKFKLIREFD